MKNLIQLSVTEMRAGLLAKEFTSQELTKAHLQRIADTNPTYNSFISVTEKIALDRAKRSDERLSKDGSAAPLLCGIPVAIKDALVTKGCKTTAASKILQDFVSPYDSTAAAKLNAAGAVLVGKTNMDEFAMGSSSEFSAFGPVKNPWDVSRVPGGTSGGSAVSVLLGQAPVALGTDTGGSIRQPAALCGVVGLKPTYGRVSRYGLIAHASSFDQIGPMGRTVEDVAILLAAIAGPDEQDATCMNTAVPDYVGEINRSAEAGLRGLRVGVPKEYMVEGAQPEVAAAYRSSLETLTSLGAEIVDISLPHTEHALACYYIITPAEASSNLSRYDGVRYGARARHAQTLDAMYDATRSLGFGPEVKRRILMGTYVLSAGYYDAYYRKAQQVRTLIINDFKAAFANACDVIATPATPATAFKIGEKTSSPLEMYLADIFTVPANIAGIPGISVPCGTDNAGLPIGLQLLAPSFAEARLLSAANAFAQASTFDSSRFRGSL